MEQRTQAAGEAATVTGAGVASLGGGLIHLANGMEIACQTATEARFLYHDIFEKQIYCRHGVSLEGAECVVDVGANIGLFTLFAARQCPGARVWAFEPAPPLFEILRSNVERYGVEAELFQCGISEARGTAELTFYPNSSGMSSFYADPEEEREALYHLMVNQLRRREPGMEEVMKHVDDLLAERLRSCTFECPLYSLSDVIREHGIRRIDFLKIDVQKSEIGVVRGIADEHWPRIRQLVLELHNTEGRFHWLRGHLEKRGFRVLAEQEDSYRESNMLNVFASRAQRDVVAKPRAAAAGEARSRAEKMKSSRKRPRRNPILHR